jgi:hypothetical protein
MALCRVLGIYVYYMLLFVCDFILIVILNLSKINEKLFLKIINNSFYSFCPKCCLWFSGKIAFFSVNYDQNSESSIRSNVFSDNSNWTYIWCNNYRQTLQLAVALTWPLQWNCRCSKTPVYICTLMSKFICRLSHLAKIKQHIVVHVNEQFTVHCICRYVRTGFWRLWNFRIFGPRFTLVYF